MITRRRHVHAYRRRNTRKSESPGGARGGTERRIRMSTTSVEERLHQPRGCVKTPAGERREPTRITRSSWGEAVGPLSFQEFDEVRKAVVTAIRKYGNRHGVESAVRACESVLALELESLATERRRRFKILPGETRFQAAAGREVA